MDRYAFGRCSRLAKQIVGVLAIIIFCFAFFNTNAAYAAENYAYCIIDVASQRILDSYNCHAQLPMASTTKTMTALIATESGKLDDIVAIPDQAVGVEGSSIYLKHGESMTLRDLTYGLMLRSGNDAATAIAYYLGGSIDGFAAIMNKKAQDLGLKNTHFTNPHGLHDDNHYTSAYDLAVIAATALDNAECAAIVRSKTYRAESGKNVRVFRNKNKLLWNYQGATGFKTGYTKRAGRCLVASADRDGMSVVAVALNIGDMFGKCSQLMDDAYHNYSLERICTSGDVVAEIPLKYGTMSAVGVSVEDDIAVAVRSSEKVSYRYILPDCIDRSLEKNDVVGKVEVFVDEQLQFSRNLVTIDKVTILEKSHEN